MYAIKDYKYKIFFELNGKNSRYINAREMDSNAPFSHYSLLTYYIICTGAQLI
jgi:hypothetical protein